MSELSESSITEPILLKLMSFFFNGFDRMSIPVYLPTIRVGGGCWPTFLWYAPSVLDIIDLDYAFVVKG